MKKEIAIIGGGPSALFLAAFINTHKYKVTIYEKNKSLGRKFLVAGKGGFNLSHSENLDQFIERYTPCDFLEPALRSFSNIDLRDWLKSIGIETFVGSSKRIYPEKGTKPIEVLKAIIRFLESKEINFEFQKEFSSWNENQILFKDNTSIKTEYTIFAMGGASWKVTGSKGDWLKEFQTKNISTNPFQSSNCTCKVNWKEDFKKINQGEPLKNISISISGKIQKGEAVITQLGIEGNAIYALSPEIRKSLKENKNTWVYIDFKPNLSIEQLRAKKQKSRYKKSSDLLKKEFKLSRLQINLLKEYLDKETFLNQEKLLDNIKKFPLKIEAMGEIEKAISTVGGIALNSIDENYQFKNYPGKYSIGEMLDWDAPTGGYLLQACFSMGYKLAEHLNDKPSSNLIK